jgi:hypothetical protein
MVEVLVQWANLGEEDATWENFDELREQFPINCLEDKTRFKGGVLSASDALVTIMEAFEQVNGGKEQLLGWEKEWKTVGQELNSSGPIRNSLEGEMEEPRKVAREA